jgi:AraC-like DNA-binding protein
MLETALLYDAAGRPLRQDHRTRSTDWDEVQAFCRDVYMPYTVRPLGKLSRPKATMYSARVGRITVTRFSYGVPIHLQDFDPAAGNILVLNTLRGSLRHMVDASRDAMTGAGESFVADCSRADYWLDGDAAHMQLNLTIPHDVMEEMAFKWYGFVPDNRLWQARLKFGGPQSPWAALLDYVARSIALSPVQVESGAFGAHLEEALSVELLRAWAGEAGIRLEEGARAAAPHYVRAAEAYFEAMAREAPTIGAAAAHAGVSARAMSEGFRRFRGISPGAFLRERRLQGVRRDLVAAAPGETVASVASAWGYHNFGMFAAAYRERFGERPSDTLRRGRGPF